MVYNIYLVFLFRPYSRDFIFLLLLVLFDSTNTIAELKLNVSAVCSLILRTFADSFLNNTQKAKKKKTRRHS